MIRKYLWYVIRHKWFVFLECCKLGIPLLGVIHDLSKFSGAEFMAYARRQNLDDYPSEYDIATAGYNGKLRNSYEEIKTGFGYGWLHHFHNNKHHPEHYVIIWRGLPCFYDHIGHQISDNIAAFPMPEPYRREYLADLRAMSRAFGNDVREWYVDNCDGILLHPDTRKWLEEQLGIV